MIGPFPGVGIVFIAFICIIDLSQVVVVALVLFFFSF